MRRILVCLIVLSFVTIIKADGPQDNIPEKVRPIPPKGVDVSPADRKELEEGLADLSKEIEALKSTLKGKANLLELLPDVQIYHKAIYYALTYDEFLNQKNPAQEIKAAKEQIKIGLERAKLLKEGKAPWTTATGLVVRGYVSKIDNSVQPYGLVVPATYKPDYPHEYRLDIWCHGRGETLNEVEFIRQRSVNPGEFIPRNTFVLHPYGRYCNANKFAGEIDVLEALAHVKKHYPIDEDRVVIRGFSMGGAACWHLAVHYPSLWCAAAPGAGFSETPDFLKVFQKETIQPTDYEQKLWRLYNATDYAINLFNCPTVAYSGEIDNQKQAADMMAKALSKERIELTHIIGPKTGHSYHPQAKVEINKRIDALAKIGRATLPKQVKFSTYTLRYNQSYWIRIDQIEKHWEQATIDAEILDNKKLRIKLNNVNAFTISMPSGTYPFDVAERPILYIQPFDENGIYIQTKPNSDGSWIVHFRKQEKRYVEVPSVTTNSLIKRHGLQGPMDDAFMDRFIMVQPTGQAKNDKISKWVSAEMKHAIDHWRKHFRGDALVKEDKAITEQDIADSNLILWGDPTSNILLTKILDKLPIQWNDQIIYNKQSFSSEHHVPVLIYPNPLNPNRYVVLNSGFTFREYDYLNNARQVPKLPDYAVIDINTPVNARYPGKIVLAGFFDEEWK